MVLIQSFPRLIRLLASGQTSEEQLFNDGIFLLPFRRSTFFHAKFDMAVLPGWVRSLSRFVDQAVAESSVRNMRIIIELLAEEYGAIRVIWPEEQRLGGDLVWNTELLQALPLPESGSEFINLRKLGRVFQLALRQGHQII